MWRTQKSDCSDHGGSKKIIENLNITQGHTEFIVNLLIKLKENGEKTRQTQSTFIKDWKKVFNADVTFDWFCYFRNEKQTIAHLKHRKFVNTPRQI